MIKNVLKRGKGWLLAISIILLVVSVGLLVGGLILAVQGFVAIGTKTAIVVIVLKIVFGILMTFLGLWGTGVGVVMLWTGAVLKTKLGNIKDYIIPAGTLNMTKCSNCGAETNEGEKVCGKCGHSLLKTKLCEACGTENEADKKFCKECGKEF